MAKFQKSHQIVIDDSGMRDRVDIPGRIVIGICSIIILGLIYLGIQAIIYIV